MGGHDVVANVVRTAQATRSLAVEAGGIVANDHVLRPNASAEWSRRSGDHRLDAALEIKTEIDDDTGTGSVAIYAPDGALVRSEEHTSELPSLMRISYSVFCLKKKKQHY